jgi:transposase
LNISVWVSRLIAYAFKYLTVSQPFLAGLEHSKEVICQDSIKDLKPLFRRWMKPCQVAREPVSVVGELPVKILSLVFTREMGKRLPFPFHRVLKRPCNPIYIKRYTKAGSLYYTDDWFVYVFLPIRGNHVVALKEKGVPKGRKHINGIESFWPLAKHWLHQYRGISKAYFPLYLKEAERRFNHRNENLVILITESTDFNCQRANLVQLSLAITK